LPCTCILLVYNKYSSETLQGKCRILRFKIIISWVMRSRNLIGGYRGFPLRHTASILRWTMKTDPRILFQNIRKHVPDSNPDRIHPHHCQHLNSCTKKYSETRNYGWKYSAGKTELWEEQYFRVLNTTFFFFPPVVYTLFHIMPLK